ncbi:MAG: DUF5684 domain-containing protein [Verrucomicrobiota bacterium]
MNDSSAGSAGGMIAGLLFLVIELGIFIVMIAALWRIFTKAGQPGWMSIIPILNVFILLKIGGKPWWWLILLCIPLVNIVFGILLALAVAENFGKSGGFVIGMVLLPMIFYPILAFSDAQYSPKAVHPLV